ncbi:MAG TPA: GNAT family N-acetyltransferase [Alphaproteobacteria bacterium]|nr:GNAT family N-acetyltransferase [Alphaproteobacteria bacterium]
MNDTQTTFRVDRFEEADKTACRALWAAYEQGKVRTDSFDALFARLWDELMAGMPSFSGFCLRDAARGEPVGFAFFVRHFCTKSTQAELYLSDLFIAEEWRGKGGGAMLMDALIAQGRSEGLERASWITRPGNLKSRTLYDRYASGERWVRYKLSLRS